ncbi:MAG TPA: hypothetical protein VGI76_08385 [Solirubrobacteraceae bacterium]
MSQGTSKVDDRKRGVATSPHRAGLASPVVRPGEPRRDAAAADREHLLDRLQRLRSILPAFAKELANTRRQAAALRVENRSLQEEVRRLRRQAGDSGAPRR